MPLGQTEILLHTFLLAGVILSFILPLKSGTKKDGRRKFYFYYLIIQLVFLSTVHRVSFMVVACIIMVAGIFEAFKLKGNWLDKAGILFFMILFILFSLKTPLDQVRMLYLVVVVFDYWSEVGGRFWGTRKLLPDLSPGKTINGLLSGITAVFLFTITYSRLYKLNLSTWLPIFMLWTTAFTGDVLASWIKRRNGIKDYSSLLPAQGGFLDRFDSLIFSAATWLLISPLF